MDKTQQQNQLPPRVQSRMVQVPELDAEEKEVREIIKQEDTSIKYRETPKFRMWVELFLDKENKTTFGNQTQSALRAYNLDPETQYFSAATIGKVNFKKVQNMGAMYLDKQGVTYGKLLDVLWNKMLQAKTPDLWFTIAEMLGINAPKYTPVSNPVYLQQNNTYETSITNYNTLNDEQLDFLIESKRRKISAIAATPGEGTADSSQAPEVLEATPQTGGSNEQPQASEGVILGEPSRKD